LIDEGHEVPHRSSQSVQPPDKQHIPVSKLCQTGVESGSLVCCARGLVGEDQFLGDAVLQKSVDLERQVLVLGTDAGIPDKASAVGCGDHGIALLSVLMCVYSFDADSSPKVPQCRFFKN
jgi:hypothetical protein